MASVPDSTPYYDRRANSVNRVFSGLRIWTYTYDHENRLTSVATDTSYTHEGSRSRVEFVYEGQGRMRTQRNYIWSGGGWYGSGGQTRYLYDGLLVVPERDSGNTSTVTYTRGRDLSGTLDGAGGIGGLLVRSHGYSNGSSTYHNFYHADGNGNVTALANSAGTLQASYIYDPFGRYLAGTGGLASANVLRFSSKPWVGFLGSATGGLYYYGYRCYDPFLQRWLNRDPSGENAGVNLFSYVGNKPAIRVDSDGRFSVPPCARWPGGIGLLAAVVWAFDALWHCDRACEYWMDFTLARVRIEANTIAAGDSTHNDEGSRADSLVHCIGACRLARDPGNCRTPERALDFLQARENRRTMFSVMDALNNIQGHSIGRQGAKDPDACPRDCTRWLNAGSLLGVNSESGQLEPWPPHEYFPVE